MSVKKIDKGIDPATGVHVFEVLDAETEELMGYDYVAPDTQE